MNKTSDLVDLVEWRWNSNLRVFTKLQTHLTNVPKAIAYAKKKKLEPIGGYNRGPKSIRFTVKPNGTYQYSNQMKSLSLSKKK